MSNDTSMGQWSLLEQRFDWITATAKRGGHGEKLIEFGFDQAEASATAGDRRNSWAFQGYQGISAGEWRVGWGREGGIIVASGQAAEMGAATLAKLADHWSRCDFCVTAIDPNPDHSIATDYWNDVSARVDRPLNAPQCCHYRNTARGETFYIGHRSSGFFARCYNKHVESDGEYPAGAWRWEVEMKRHVSEHEHVMTKNAARSNVWASMRVRAEFERQGFPVPWWTPPLLDRAKCPPRKRDVERIQKWMESQIKPSTEFLAQHLGATETRRLLGL